MRSEAGVEVLSAPIVGGAAADGDGWALEDGDTDSAWVATFSVASILAVSTGTSTSST